jgi:single-strand DNA-binding protein
MAKASAMGKSNAAHKSNAMDEAIVRDDYENEVRLVGRSSGPALEKELPSGDKVVEIRIVVARDDRDGYDTLDVALWSAALRKRALSLKDNEWIEVVGALRRRFWKTGNVVASRWQVEGRELTRV